MKRNDMRLAPLAVLYQHRNDYSHHQRKLQSIKLHRPQRENIVDFERMELVRQNLQKFEQRQHTRSLELARQNHQIVTKLQNIRSILNFKSNAPTTPSRMARIPSCKSNILNQSEAKRIKQRVNSMSSELSRKSLLRDYERSTQIRNRIMRYKTEHNNKVCLKADKVLTVNKHRSVVITARLQHKNDSLPIISKENRKTEDGINCLSAIKRGRKQQAKSKLQMKQRLFKISQERRVITEAIMKERSSGSRGAYTFCTAVESK